MKPGIFLCYTFLLSFLVLLRCVFVTEDDRRTVETCFSKSHKTLFSRLVKIITCPLQLSRPFNG